MTDSTDDRLRTGGAFDAWPAEKASIESALRGRVISGYKVGDVVGVGGMGCVLHATRAEGDFDREAAIKVVAASHDSSELVRRFRLEVQILAKLIHPCIAQLYDAGITDEGWPYLIMEYVDGMPIDDYCKQHQLRRSEKLDLLKDVIDAVQFSHSHLIVHRDIKPSNVLVGTDGKPKLLDFGIAKLLEDDAEDATRLRAMTPQYASPEQLLGQPISTASDIYQLGLLISIVMGGALPTDGETLTAAIQRCAEGRLVTLPSAMRQSLPAELVLIIEQCLRVDPSDRYRGANSLRDDLDAYTTGYPVRAAGQRAGYRMRKFVQRNWGGVVGGALTFLLLIGATVITTQQTIEAREQRDLALYQQQRVQASSEFFSLILEEMGDGEFTAIDLLDRGRSMLEAQFGEDQPFMSSVLFDVSQRYANLGERNQERVLLIEAERLARINNDENMLTAALCGLANANQMAEPETAIKQLEEGLARYETLASPNHEATVECAVAHSRIEIRAGNNDAALEILSEGLATLDRHPVPSVRGRVLILSSMSQAYFRNDELIEAVDHLDQMLRLLDNAGRGRTLLYQRFAANKAVAQQEMGRVREALATFEDLWERSETSAFEGRGNAIQLAQYADLLVDAGRFDEAITTYEQAFDIADATGYVRVAGALKLGLAKASLNKMDLGAARQHLEAADTYISDGKPVGLANGVRMRWAKLYRLEGELSTAKTEIDALVAALGYPASDKGSGLNKVLGEAAEIYRALDRYEQAEVFADSLLKLLTAQSMDGSVGNVRLGSARLLRASIRFETGAYATAKEDLAEALPHLQHGLDPSHALLQQAASLGQSIDEALARPSE
ncbi:MAG: protein kinase [Pseudomonadota bacterium]